MSAVLTGIGVRVGARVTAGMLRMACDVPRSGRTVSYGRLLRTDRRREVIVNCTFGEYTQWALLASTGPAARGPRLPPARLASRLVITRGTPPRVEGCRPASRGLSAGTHDLSPTIPARSAGLNPSVARVSWWVRSWVGVRARAARIGCDVVRGARAVTLDTHAIASAAAPQRIHRRTRPPHHRRFASRGLRGGSADDRGDDEDDVEGADRGGHRPCQHGRRASVDGGPEQRPVGREPHQRHQRERQPEGEHHL